MDAGEWIFVIDKRFTPKRSIANTLNLASFSSDAGSEELSIYSIALCNLGIAYRWLVFKQAYSANGLCGIQFATYAAADAWLRENGHL